MGQTHINIRAYVLFWSKLLIAFSEMTVYFYSLKRDILISRKVVIFFKAIKTKSLLTYVAYLLILIVLN